MAIWEGVSFTKSQKKGLWLAFWLIGGLCLFLWGKRYFPPDAPDLSYLPQLEQAEEKPRRDRPQSATPRQRIEANTADSTAWASLPGIGPVLSRRIIRFRTAKGGFRNLSELEQVYGLPPETWERIQPLLYLDPAHLPVVSPAPVKVAISPIDINQADSLEWRQLPGIGPVLSRRILKYRDLLGAFRTKGDLRNVYGLSAETFETIEPYLLLDTTLLTAETQTPSAPNEPTSLGIPSPAVARRVPPTVELNQADSAQLIALPGIGKKLAPRIIRYRESLGFFVEVEQLRSVYGLSEENFQRFLPYVQVKVPDSPPKKDLNTASLRQLRYLSEIEEAWAQEFLAYRKQLGRFTRWEEVENFPGMTPSISRLLRAYFTLTNP